MCVTEVVVDETWGTQLCRRNVEPAAADLIIYATLKMKTCCCKNRCEKNRGYTVVHVLIIWSNI